MLFNCGILHPLYHCDALAHSASSHVSPDIVCLVFVVFVVFVSVVKCGMEVGLNHYLRSDVLLVTFC